MPTVGIIMGSQSDFEAMKGASEVMDEFQVGIYQYVVSL